jgi:hypothetical protein
MRLSLRHFVLPALMAAVAAPAFAQATAPSSQPAGAPPAAADQPAAPVPAAPAEPSKPVASAAVALPDGLSAPPEGKGQVVFFRPSNFVGMAVSFSVHEGDKGVAKLGNGSYAVVVTDPGPHAYSIQFEAKDVLNMEVEAGETYYVRQTIGMGVVAARPHLTPSDAGEFAKQKLKLSGKTATDLRSGSSSN